MARKRILNGQGTLWGELLHWLPLFSHPFIICLSGSIALHLLVLSAVSDTTLPGRLTKESAQSPKMMLYVGLGEARATVPRTPAEGAIREIHPIFKKNRPGSGAIGVPTPKQGPAKPTPNIQDESLSTFLPSSQLDRGALPITEPDSTLLNGIQSSGHPIRLRLYINAHGLVTDIRVLQADDFDKDAITQIKAMFFATAFIAGRHQGKDVPSYIDIELTISEFTGVPSTAIRQP